MCYNTRSYAATAVIQIIVPKNNIIIKKKKSLLVDKKIHEFSCGIFLSLVTAIYLILSPKGKKKYTEKLTEQPRIRLGKPKHY